MKQVILKNISLLNFRGEKNRTTEFNDSETSIMGANGLGKSRHFDAFMWLLFGKDTQERKDYNIKSLVNGATIDKVDCEVAATLLVGTETIKLRRVYTEKWVKKRGEIIETFEGNKTETYWNDVPVNVTEYQKRINDIIDDSVFKMVTNPLYFANMKWQDQRDVLFQLAGTITDADIASKNPEFAALLDKISGKSLADFKRELSARKKRLKDDLAQIQPRIDQTQKLMPDAINYDALEGEINKLNYELTAVDNAISDVVQANSLHNEKLQAKQSEINELKQKLQEIDFYAQTKAKDEVYERDSVRRDVQNNINAINAELSIAQKNFAMQKREIDSLQATITLKETSVVSMREAWHAENAKAYQGDETCHACGQDLPENMKADALNLFNKDKAAKLAEITASGAEINAEIERLNKSVSELNESLKTAEIEITEKAATLAQLREQYAAIRETDVEKINVSELPDYIATKKLLTVAENELQALKANNAVDVAELRDKKTALSTEISAKQAKLNDRTLIAKYQAEITDLGTQGKELAQQIANAEREEYTIQQFTKAKIDECENRINGLFTQVTFKLFDYTIDGNEYETCVPLVKGVPFDVANTAGQVNAGLDIINALVRFHGVSAPIFIDGRESVNSIINTASQIINLVVTTDKELVIK